jgi:hypothetical protein
MNYRTYNNNSEKYQSLSNDLIENKNLNKNYTIIIPKQARHDSICGCICCLFWLFGFLLCLFLIPYRPTAQIHDIQCFNNGECVGNFKFTNNNFYKTEWRNPKLSLYWIPYNGQTVGQNCYNNGNYCNTNFYKTCAIKIGDFESTTKFTIDGKYSKIKELYLVNSTSQELACTSWMLLNSYEDLAQRLLSSGHVNVKTVLNDFGNVYIKEEYYYLY